MGDSAMNDSLALDDEDRLPWLEPAYGDDADEEVSLLRLGVLIVAGLVLLALIVGAVYLIRNRLVESSEPQVIAAPSGAYKVPANSADAKKFDGEGDDSFAASEGQERSGVIDPSKLPETPITKTVSAPPPASQSAQPAGAKVVSAVVKPSQTAAKPTAPVATAKSGGPMIQLGAYNNEAQAKSSWSRLAKRFDYLSALTYSIEPVTVNGTQFYRLRVATTQANILCGKLKVAGESCMVVN